VPLKTKGFNFLLKYSAQCRFGNLPSKIQNLLNRFYDDCNLAVSLMVSVARPSPAIQTGFLENPRRILILEFLENPTS
jgi:hypothetical protein